MCRCACAMPGSALTGWRRVSVSTPTRSSLSCSGTTSERIQGLRDRRRHLSEEKLNEHDNTRFVTRPLRGLRRADVRVVAAEPRSMSRCATAPSWPSTCTGRSATGRPSQTAHPVVWMHTAYQRGVLGPDGKVQMSASGYMEARDLTLYGYVLAIVDTRGKGASFGSRRGMQDSTEGRRRLRHDRVVRGPAVVRRQRRDVRMLLPRWQPGQRR